jgi:NADH:ubiquinone oxidoreductase subunit 5 (subunit L)/multisubunit Na+/H+ antiporter MnhA subunit
LLRNPKKQRPDCQKYEQGRLTEASEEGLGSKRAVVPMMMMMMMIPALVLSHIGPVSGFISWVSSVTQSKYWYQDRFNKFLSLISFSSHGATAPCGPRPAHY